MIGIYYLFYIDEQKKIFFVKVIESIHEMPDFSVQENKKLLLLKEICYINK